MKLTNYPLFEKLKKCEKHGDFVKLMLAEFSDEITKEHMIKATHEKMFPEYLPLLDFDYLNGSEIVAKGEGDLQFEVFQMVIKKFIASHGPLPVDDLLEACQEIIEKK